MTRTRLILLDETDDAADADEVCQAVVASLPVAILRVGTRDRCRAAIKSFHPHGVIVVRRGGEENGTTRLVDDVDDLPVLTLDPTRMKAGLGAIATTFS